jgi:hypothetical protein
MDRHLSQKLENGQSALVKYVDGPRNFNQIIDIEDNIRHFVHIMKSDDIEFDKRNVEKLKALLAKQDFLQHSNYVLYDKEPVNALLFSMFQARNPDLRATSENFLKGKLNKPKVEMKYSSASNKDIVVALSTEITHQPDYCLDMDKQMIRFYDHKIFYDAFAQHIIDDIVEKQKSRGSLTKLDEYYLAPSINKEFEKYTPMQTALVQGLVSKIEKVLSDQVWSKQSKTQILQNLQLIDNPHIEKSDFTHDTAKLLSLDDTDKEGEISQSRDQHWRMMQLFAYIRKHSDVMEASWSRGGVTEDELQTKFNKFYDDIYQNSIESIFPSTDQSIFLQIWKKTKNFNEGGDSLSHDFLREMYDANKSIFWIPILALVIKDEAIPPEYWHIANTIEIPESDAASYLDFLCRWVYPLSYDSDQKEKLLGFSKVLSKDGGFTQLFSKSHYLSQNLLGSKKK